MRPTTNLLQLAVCLSSLAPLASAWPSWLPEVDALVVRQDSSSETTAASAEETGGATASEPAPTETDGGGDLNTAKAPTGTETPSGTKTGDSEPTRTSFAANDPPGGVSMLTPAASAAATPLFKIGDYVTLGWNYTSLQAEPSAIDVLISCSTASETWTLTSNMTFETSVDFVWNTDDQAESVESPLLTEMYTLIIKDAEADITDMPEPGYLGSFSQFTFGLYHPIDYTPFPDWECTACNAAVSGLDRHALGLALTMSIISVLSFTWFVTGLGLH